MTPGQQQALDQLNAIARASESIGWQLEVVSIEKPAKDGGDLIVDVSVSCKSLLTERLEGGLPLQERERFLLSVPPGFPFKVPSVNVPHERFAGFAHVQWKRHLCLYQATDVEWNPSDGMFGLMSRLDVWLKRGAKNELDETGAPIHPPVAYAGSDAPLAVIRMDAPAVEPRHWIGTVRLEILERRVDLLDWVKAGDGPPKGPVAAAVFLPAALPFEYPGKAEELLRHIVAAGVPEQRFINLLRFALLFNDEKTPLYIAVGAPGRGIKGVSDLKHHLVVWKVDELSIKALRLSLCELDPDPKLQEIGARAMQLVRDCLKLADITWCRVAEQRPEVVARRDRDSPLSWVRGKTISIWGCGALGGFIAEAIARAGASKLILRDNGTVTPGLLVRQNFVDTDVGRFKTLALSDRLKKLRPGLEVHTSQANLIDFLDTEDWTEGADLVIDASASEAVAKKLESRRTAGGKAPIFSTVIGHDASMGMGVFCAGSWSGAVADAYRKAKVAVCSDPMLKPIANEFWPTKPRDIFQPEPGCSSPTFVASAADAMLMATSLLNLAIAAVAAGEPAGAFFVTAPGRHASLPIKRFTWQNDQTLRTAEGDYEVRIHPSAQRELRAWINRGARVRGRQVETGGLLFGEIDDAARVIWVSDASGPPPDSTASASGFVCGTKGTDQMNLELKDRSRGSVAFVGTWHTHPGMAARPSDIDLSGMHDIVCSPDFRAPRSLLIIIGGDLNRNPQYTAMMFDRSRFETARAPA